jgi:signal transduction histidine kinase
VNKPFVETGAEIGAGQRSGRRILAVDAALLIILMTAAQLAVVRNGSQAELPVWFVVVGGLAPAGVFLAGLVANRVSDLTLRVVAFLAVAAFWLTLITFPAAVPAGGIDRIPWTLTASGAAVAAALVAGGRGLAWTTVTITAATGLAYRAIYGGLDLDGVVNDMQALLTGAVICVIGGHILAVGRGLDREAASTAASASLESAESGRLTARTVAASLVHDEVLATLALAASGLPIPQDRLAAQARQAVATVTSLADDQAHEPVALSVAVAAEARRHGVSCTVQGSVAASSVRAFTPTHDALIGAMRQALRNSIQHAPDAARSVRILHTGSEVRVEIIDDGPGFDPAQIAHDRLGIRQSIIGRMSRLPGGSAEIDSAPGRGTVVRLRWAVEADNRIVIPDNRVSLRVGFFVVAVIYVGTQTTSAILAALAVPGTWPLHLTMLLTLLAAGLMIRAAPTRVPSGALTSLVVALAGGGMVVGVSAAYLIYGIAFSYGSLWFTVATAFLFVALALRGRMGSALGGTALIVAASVCAGVLENAPVHQIVQLAIRPVVLVGLAVALLVVVERMQRRIVALHKEAVRSAEKQSWALAARSELTGRVAELARTALPLLRRIGTGVEPTDAQRNEYTSCEGELRDGLRAGSLAREPLRAAVAAARERGVDVVLLDDNGGFVDNSLIDPILTWMAESVATSRTRVVGRLLPPGRQTQASLTVDGQHTEFTVTRVSAAEAQPLRLR